MHSINEAAFAQYGKSLAGYDFTDLINKLEETTEKPSDRVIYTPSDPALEALDVFIGLRDRAFGGMPIQIGYCNGTNSKLNCLEYHRGCEVLVAADELVLIVAKLQDICDGKLDTAKAEMFIVPRGAGVLTYETTLHYAPARAKGGFRSVIVLPRGTNTEAPQINAGNPEDKLLFARNKWLIAHPDTSEAKSGAFVGLYGANVDIS